MFPHERLRMLQQRVKHARGGPRMGYSTSSEARADVEPTVICPSLLRQIVTGVVVATKLSSDVAQPVLETLQTFGKAHRPLQVWLREIEQCFAADDDSKQVAKLALAVSHLLQQARQGVASSKHDMDHSWRLICDSLRSDLISKSYQQANRSAQGFIAVPLCSILQNGNIHVLFRLHVWLPDGQRGAPGFGIHSHQPFATSWVLAGSGTDHSYEVRESAVRDNATHAIYALAWTSGADLDQTYKTHQTYSKVVNTQRYVAVKHSRVAHHTRGMSYSVAPASFHSSAVPHDQLHATLFAFDSAQGFVRDAPVLGPRDEVSSTQTRETPGVTPAMLADLVEVVREWEDNIAAAETFVRQQDWDGALGAICNADKLIEECSKNMSPQWYRARSLGLMARLLPNH